ncbi:family 78 glycoside hydrolase catalytic domain [Pedobacter sp. SYP-B3415]|uniref:family 78 glycoside hydrolase catalytic domain n=1 Tax=Pedobacter sp. SYP-B3415 TaxID=2496641 RepID=UPI001F0DAD94|nr:family 78 glycoside hydrolase catalytic domain [Pedobacter sp. SYP-B3415]
MSTISLISFRMVRFFAVIVVLSVPMHLLAGTGLAVDGLTCAYRKNPLGVDQAKPALSWQLRAADRGIMQTAYRVMVADQPELLLAGKANIWDSGRLNGSTTQQISFGGKTLQAARVYYWRVAVWDNKGRQAWSPVASWQMGLLTPGDWKKAAWIGYEKMPDSSIDILPSDKKKFAAGTSNVLPMLRREFRIAKKIKRATAFVSGLGHFELTLNGKKVGDHFLDPGWTKYDKQALYVTFDISKELRWGANALGVMLGNGFYYTPPVKGRYRKLKSTFGYPKMICRVLLEYTDGSQQNIVSDTGWKTAPSPITFSSIYGGEDYDARLEQSGWDMPGFNDRSWKAAVLTGGPALSAQQTAPMRFFDRFEPKSVKAVAKGWVYDLGQNASGIIRLEVKGKRGDTVRIRQAELLNEDGTINQKPSGSPSYFTYVLKGGETETWQPRFFYSGFRYLQVEGAIPAGQPEVRELPRLRALSALHVRNAATQTGTFACSEPLFNKTFELINWATKSNMASVFTDCPHREKLGWLEQVHLMGASVRYNFDVAPMFRKALEDMRNSQTAEGLVPEIAPEYVKFDYGDGMFRDSPEWGSSSILAAWNMYEWYGDKNALHENYGMIRAYLAYLAARAKGNLLFQGLGDWYDLGPNPPGVSQLTPMGVTASAIYYLDLVTAARIAAVLGNRADASAYAALAQNVRIAFNKKFFDAATGQYATGSQTANAMALYMDMAEPANRAKVLENLIADIRRRGNSLTAGDIGYRYVLRVLEQEGRSDVIYDMNSRSDVPGYGYQLAQGATALTESWAALPSVSNNHFMLGHLMEWLYSGLGGIRQDTTGLAFSKIIIRPEPVGDIRHAAASYDSPSGTISTRWKRDGSEFMLETTIPPNTSATVYLPAEAGQRITESGMNARQHPDIKILRSEEKNTLVAVGSGTYKFLVK